ncbi:hypothetical protein Lalb_Chr12g0198591 [Lupinus albus]|uniref:Uncharacterized protein n=1 Tax=Lupinus albus TaxID=3870 RepID=A0A6A4PM25_LUPAL|nr:hypothetical protein Lalb_Chr12g0198591 [Lupinus albus]
MAGSSLSSCRWWRGSSTTTKVSKEDEFCGYKSNSFLSKIKLSCGMLFVII